MSDFTVCVLSLWLSSFNCPKEIKGNVNPKTELFRRLEAFGGPVREMQYKHWEDVRRAAWQAPRLTIFVIDGPYEVWLYFKDHGWELLPFRIDGKWIVRKRISTSA